MAFAGIEEVAEQKVRVAMLQIGESKVELLEPTSGESPVARFIEKNGAGIHHIAYEVADIETAIAKLLAGGARMIDEKPRHVDLLLRYGQVDEAHGESIAGPEAVFL